jgi:hypothetical protein
MQQRGIRPEALEALLDFGRSRPTCTTTAARSSSSTKKAKARLVRARPDAAREAERLVRTYAIVGSNGVVVTVGHRYRRIGSEP